MTLDNLTSKSGEDAANIMDIKLVKFTVWQNPVWVVAVTVVLAFVTWSPYSIVFTQSIMLLRVERISLLHTHTMNSLPQNVKAIQIAKRSV